MRAQPSPTQHLFLAPPCSPGTPACATRPNLAASAPPLHSSFLIFSRSWLLAGWDGSLTTSVLLCGERWYQHAAALRAERGRTGLTGFQLPHSATRGESSDTTYSRLIIINHHSPGAGPRWSEEEAAVRRSVATWLVTHLALLLLLRRLLSSTVRTCRVLRPHHRITASPHHARQSPIPNPRARVLYFDKADCCTGTAQLPLRHSLVYRLPPRDQ